MKHLSHPSIGTALYVGLLLLAAAVLAGCGTLDGKLENRVACTAAKDAAFVVSLWGPVGISATIADQDRAVICK
jgi:hypothetical protein